MCVSLNPLRRRHQDGIKCARILLGAMPVNDNGVGAQKDEEGAWMRRLEGACLTPRKGQREEGRGSLRSQCSLRKAQHNL